MRLTTCTLTCWDAQVAPDDNAEPAAHNVLNFEPSVLEQVQSLFPRHARRDREAPIESIASLEPSSPTPRSAPGDVDETRDVDVVAAVANGALTLSYLDLDDVWSIESALDLVKEMVRACCCLLFQEHVLCNDEHWFEMLGSPATGTFVGQVLEKVLWS